MLRHHVVISSSRHGVEVFLGYFTEDIDFERVLERQKCFLIEVVVTSDGEHPDWIVLQEGRRNKEFLKLRGDTLRYVLVCKAEEVIHQPQTFDNWGIDWIDELEKCFEDVGGFGEWDDVESGTIRSVAGWLGDGEGVPEGDRCDG